MVNKEVKNQIFNNPKNHRIWIKENYDKLVDSFLEDGKELPPYIWQNYLEFCHDVSKFKEIRSEILLLLLQMKLFIINDNKFNGDLEKALEYYHEQSVIRFKDYANILLENGDYTDGQIFDAWQNNFHDNPALSYEYKFMIISFVLSFFTENERTRMINKINDKQLIVKQNEIYLGLRKNVAANIYNIANGKTSSLISLKEGFLKLLFLGYLNKYDIVSAYILEYYSKMLKNKSVQLTLEHKLGGEKNYKSIIQKLNNNYCLNQHIANIKGKTTLEFFDNNGFCNIKNKNFNPFHAEKTLETIQPEEEENTDAENQDQKQKVEKPEEEKKTDKNPQKKVNNGKQNFGRKPEPE